MSEISARGSRDAFLTLCGPIAAIAVVILVAWAFFDANLAPGTFGFDFRGTMWEAGRSLTSGRSPYPESVAQLTAGNPALYPPAAIAVALPLTLLPWNAAVIVWVLLLVAGTAGGLWFLGVRDILCYCLLLTSLPVLQGALFGNFALLLLLGVGAAWRWRERAPALGFIVAAVVIAKLFLWPLLIWLVLLRRFRAAAWAVCGLVILLLVPWSVIGFRGLSGYPGLLRAASDVYGPHSYSLVAAGVGLHLPLHVAQLLCPLAGGLVLVLAAVVSRKADADARVFAIVILASIATSPIVWNYYLVLLVAPIAVLRPRFSVLWLVLPLTYVIDRIPPGRNLLGARPADVVPYFAWDTLHSTAAVGPALGVAGVVVLLAVRVLVWPTSPSEAPHASVTEAGHV